MSDSNGVLKRAVAGDESALVQLLEAEGPAVERSLSIGREWRSVLEPADVMQVTYLEAFLRITQFDPKRSESFAGWLRRIAQNNLKDAIRGLQRQKRPQPADRVNPEAVDANSELLAMLGVATTTPSRHAGQNERAAMLATALDMLPDDYAAAIRHYDLEGLPIVEVAKRMGRSVGAVHMLRARAYDRLRESLGSESKWFSSTS